MIERPQHRPAVDGADWMQLEQERRHDAEVAAAAAHRPEQVLVLLCTSGDKAAIGQYYINTQQVIDCQAMGTREIADATTQCQPADASRRDEAAGRGQAERMRGVVNLAPRATTLNSRRACGQVDANTLHAREID